jgi:uncharacterized metal-binding protein
LDEYQKRLSKITSRQYRTLTPYQTLISHRGIHHTIEFATYIHDELAYWISFFVESEKINVLHVQRFKKLTALDLDVLLRLVKKDKEFEIARRKRKLQEKEKEEIQAEEAIVRSLLMEN